MLAATSLTQLAGLSGVIAGMVLAFWHLRDPGFAMVVSTAFVLLAWVLTEGVPTFIGMRGRAPVRTEGRWSFWKRIITKLVGLYALSGLAILAYLIFPFFAGLKAVEWLLTMRSELLAPAMILLPLTIAYVALTDRFSDNPDDYLHQTGRAVLMQEFRETDINFALRIFVIKAFFLSIMLSSGISIFAWFFENPSSERPFLSMAWFDSAIRAIYLADVILAAGGYLSTFKLFGWHIRETETALRGWVVCLICYEPFSTSIFQAFVPYGEGPGWDSAITEGSILFLIWMIAVFLCHLIYVWATLALGPRFSNLTHRGIIASGPYYFTKHPAYLAKNMAWWLFALPAFYASGILEGMERAIMLAIISFIYFQRARAEEVMLGRDPDYRAYARDVAARSPLRATRQWIRTKTG